MENNIRFRNHISVVPEQLGAAFGVIFVLFITNVDDLIRYIEDGSAKNQNMTLLIGVGAVFVILVLTFLYQLVLWAKTYISVCDNSIVIERNTLSKKKNTIGIKNISNVNTEQNLFEMICGTCKVKLDTDSMSTADKTDVKIVLKKAEAEQFRLYIMKLMKQNEGGQWEETVEEGRLSWDLEADFGDIFMHGLLSVNLLSLLIVLGGIVGAVGMIGAALEKAGTGESIAGMLLSFTMVIVLFFSAIRDIAKGFFRYYGFKIARSEDKLYIRYGFFKKVNYTIPIGKINALKVKQTWIARITGRYMAEIINIGMGDDDAETEAFLFPYCKKEKMEERIRQFLPEFEQAVKDNPQKQPIGVWIAWLWPLFLYALFTGIATAIGILYFPQYEKWILGGVFTFSVWMFALLVFRYLTVGSMIGEEYLILVNGYFAKTFFYISYRNMQHIELQQNFLARFARVQKGEIHLLASSANRVQGIPYFQEKDGELIREKMLKKY